MHQAGNLGSQATLIHQEAPLEAQLEWLLLLPRRRWVSRLVEALLVAFHFTSPSFMAELIRSDLPCSGGWCLRLQAHKWSPAPKGYHAGQVCNI
jgi:hypothetical protein